MLELKNVSFRYAKNLPLVLDGVSLSFDKGEFVAITGRNGSGKTTITRLLTGLEKPASGDIVYNGTSVTKEDASKRSRFIGYVFQQPDRQMFMPTVREEIAFGPFHQGKRGQELEDAIDRAMADTDTESLSAEYPRTLSRGDQQRVAIASALAMDTEYLVLDEPTSGQDGREKKRLMALMERLQQKGITIILVTHDMDIVARDCTRVVVIAGHKVVFDDKPEILFSEANRPEDWGLAYPPAVLLAPPRRSLLPGHGQLLQRIYETERRSFLMRNLVPLTKILLTLGTAVWAIVLHRPESLLYLCVLELLILLISGELFKNIKALIMLIIFAALLGAIEKVGGGSTEESVVAALRMLGMTIIFIYLLGTVKLQDLTASMVRQLKVPYEYAFMFTAGLRFIPDFIEENRAVSEAQACRGLAVKGNFFKQVKRYMSIVRPLMLRSLGRSETMALSLELRGFGGSRRTFMESVAPKGKDYVFMVLILLVTAAVIYGRVKLGM